MHNKLYRACLIIIIAIAVPIIPFVIIGEMPGATWLSSSDDNATWFALTGGALLALDIALPLPSSIIGSLIGARLGLVPGFFTILTGLTLGHIGGYLFARVALHRLHGQLPELPTLLVIFLSRPVPVLAEAMALAAGASAVPFTRFLLVCLAGNAVYAAVLAGNGAALLPDHVLGLWLLLPMLLPVIAWIAWRWIAARHARTVTIDDAN